MCEALIPDADATFQPVVEEVMLYSLPFATPYIVWGQIKVFCKRLPTRALNTDYFKKQLTSASYRLHEKCNQVTATDSDRWSCPRH